MKLSQLKELVRQVVKEEGDYQQFFRSMLDKTGKDINSMSDEEKKKFFNTVDNAYKAKNESRKKINEQTYISDDKSSKGKQFTIKDSDISKYIKSPRELVSALNKAGFNLGSGHDSVEFEKNGNGYRLRAEDNCGRLQTIRFN